MKLENYIDSAITDLHKIKDLLPKVNGKQPVLGSDSRDYPPEFSHGGWDCKNSPTKNCMYTIDWDCCIFCEEPNERK